MIKVKEDGHVDISIYRKPTHTDQYLSFESNHHIKQKLGIISTFQHRVDSLVTNEEDKNKEKIYTEKALKKCGYPNWCFKKKSNKKRLKNDNNYPVITVPYISKISEKIARSFREHGIKTVHKPPSTIKNILFNNKDKIHHLDKTGIVYEVNCERHEEKYIGETD